MKLPSLQSGLLLALVACAALPKESARADTIIFDNLSTQNAGFNTVSTTTYSAQRFNTDAINLRLTSATLNLSVAGTGTFFLRLYSDSAGQPGTSLATLFSGTTAGPSGNILFGGLNQLLLANTNYWLVLGLNSGSTLSLGWGVANSGSGTGSGFQTFSGVTSNQGSTWSVTTAAPRQTQITATTVPEPSTTM